MTPRLTAVREASPDDDARAKLLSVFDICHYERSALAELCDERLDAVLAAMKVLCREVEAALSAMTPEETSGSQV